MADTSTRLQIPDASMAGPSQSSKFTGSTRPASTQVYASSVPTVPPHHGSQSSRKRASHTITSQVQHEEHVGYRDVYAHPAAVAYAAAHPKRTIPKFGPYLLLQTLGEGEFGKVKLGLHQQWGEEVAVKLIRRGNIDTAVRMSKVEREIEVLRTIKHPNIVRLYDVIETDKYIGIILEYASGGELFDHILAHRYLKEKDACKLFSQLISGVWYIHQKKIVHRDLKLENLLLDRYRNVIITDFGFANRFEHRADDLMQTSCGSPCYAAPELVISEGLYVGSAVDIWSCGVILYAMLAGYLPFDDDPANPDGDNINLLYRYIVNTPLTFPDYVSAEARDLLSLMLVPDPAHRADLNTIMAHRWLKPYAHLFERTVQDLERLAMEQHQMKRLAYQRQMKQQAAAAAAEQSKMQRSQSARTDGPVIPNSSMRGRQNPSAMNPEFLYDTTADESLFTSPPPVPVIPPSSRRHVASAVVSSVVPMSDDDPFGPPLPYRGQHENPDIPSEMFGEPHSYRSKESSSRSSRKQPPPVAIEPVKMSPDRKRADRQRHTVQLEYGEAQDDMRTMQQPSRGQELVTAGQLGADAAEDPPTVTVNDMTNIISDLPGSDIISELRSEASRGSVNRMGSISKAVKPLPVPPDVPAIDNAVPKRTSSIPTVRSQNQTESTILMPLDNQTVMPPIVSVTPTSPPRAENVPPTVYESPRTINGKVTTGSINSTGSGSSKNRRAKGMSVDKLVGKLWGSASDTEGAIMNSAKGSRRPSETSVLVDKTQSPPDSLSVRRPSTLQASPSPDSKSSTKTRSSNEGKKSRRNTLTVMVEPLSKRISQRSKGRTNATDNGAIAELTKPREFPSPVVPSKMNGKEEMTPATPHFPTGVRPGVTPITGIPASTNKASKVMAWFRYRSKSRGPSETDNTEISEGYENVARPGDDATTPTAERKGIVPASSSDTINASKKNGITSTVSTTETNQPQALLMGRSPPSLSSEASVPPIPQARSKNIFSSIVATPSARRVGYNKNAIRLHNSAIDQTTVTTGSPPEVMAIVTKVLLDMGLEVQQETEYKYRCIRSKRKKAGTGSTTAGLTAFTMIGSAASNGVDKRGLPVPSQSGFSSGGMLKGLLMRRQSSQVSSGGSVSHQSFSFEEPSNPANASLTSTSREKLSTMPSSPAHEPIYGERTIDQGDEVRFSVELTRIDGLKDTFCLDIRRLKGHLRSYKFLYDTLRERCELPR